MDSADLQVDQLLIGCILFTITICLFPTTLIFYVSYLLIWLLIFCTQSLLRLALLLFFSFPTCIIAFRALFPHLFAAGVSFEPIYALPRGCRPSCGGRYQHMLQGFTGTKEAVVSGGDDDDGGPIPPPSPNDKSGGLAAPPSSNSNLYFMLYARPISFGEIIWPPLRAAARATLAPLRPSALFPKILNGKIVRLSRYNSAWPSPSGPLGES